MSSNNIHSDRIGITAVIVRIQDTLNKEMGSRCDYFYKSTHGTDAGHYYHETRLASVLCGDEVDITGYTGIRRLNIRSSSKKETKNGSR